MKGWLKPARGNGQVLVRRPLRHRRPRHALVLLDATVYPADNVYLQNALKNLTTAAHFGNHVLGHLQLPVLQSNTTSKALLKHTRLIEDALVGSGISPHTRVTLQFTLPPDGAASDKRKLSQACIACASDPDKLSWMTPPVIGPLPLCKISDMKGYDAEQRPGPSARAEQSLD